jgi:hypothetical protein
MNKGWLLSSVEEKENRQVRKEGKLRGGTGYSDGGGLTLTCEA